MTASGQGRPRPTVLRPAAGAVAALVAAAAWAGGPAELDAQAPSVRSDHPWCDAQRGRPWLQRRCEVHEIALTAPGGPLEVDAGLNGGIEVRAWDRDELLLVARLEAQAEEPRAAAALLDSMRVVTSGHRVRVEAPEPSAEEWASSDFLLYVPEQSALRLTTLNGNIRVTGVHGALLLESRNGGIELAAVGGEVRGRTSNGGLHLILQGLRWIGDGLTLSTVNGGATIIVPADYSAVLHASTIRGRLDIDGLPLECDPPGGGCASRRVRGPLGAGGALVRVSSENGGVRISHGR